MPPFFDKRGRLLPKKQLAAIFAKAERQGIPDTEINATKLTSINDEIIAGRANDENENKVIDRALRKHFNVKAVKPKKKPDSLEGEKTIPVKNLRGRQMKIIDLIRKVSVLHGINHAEGRRLLESEGLIPAGISDDADLEPKAKNLAKLDELTKSPPVNEPQIEKEVVKAVKTEQKKKAEVKRKISDAVIFRAIETANELKKKNKEQEKENLATRELLQDTVSSQLELSILTRELAEEQAKTSTTEEGLVKNVVEKPLDANGLISGIDPLKREREETLEDKIRRRAMELRIMEGLPQDVASRQARTEVVRRITT